MTLPSEVREALEIEEGDILEFELIKVVRKPDRATKNQTTNVSDERLSA